MLKLVSGLTRHFPSNIASNIWSFFDILLDLHCWSSISLCKLFLTNTKNWIFTNSRCFLPTNNEEEMKKTFSTLACSILLNLLSTNGNVSWKIGENYEIVSKFHQRISTKLPKVEKILGNDSSENMENVGNFRNLPRPITVKDSSLRHNYV